MQNDEMSPKEQELLKKLQYIETLSFDLVHKIDNLEKELSKKDEELSSQLRKTITLQEENQSLKEVLQTWQERINTIFKEIGID